MRGALAAATVAMAVAVASGATAPGIQGALTQKGMTWLANTGRELLLAKMKTIEIADYPFDQSSIKGTLTDIVCDDLAVGGVSLTVDPTTGISGEISGVGIQCTGNWEYKYQHWPHFSGHGDVELSVSASSAALSVAIGSSDGHPKLTSEHCASNIDISSLHFHGGLSGWILNLFHKLIERYVEDAIDSALCKEATTLINVDANNVLASYNPLVALPFKAPYDIAEVDFSIAADPVGSDYISADLHGEVYHRNAHTEAPFTPKALPPLDVSSVTSHMMEIALSPYVVNSAVYVYRTAGLLNYTITAAEVPPQVPIKLSTETFADWAPQMEKQYPNTPMNLRVSALGDPDIELANGDCNVTVPIELVFIVAPNDTAPVEAFGLTCPFKLDATVSVNNTSKVTIQPKLLFLDCPVALEWSKMGTVNADMIKAFVGAILGSVAVPMANQALAGGFPLPSVDGLSFQNMQLAFTDSYLQVLTDAAYTPTAAASAQLRGEKLSASAARTALRRASTVSLRV